MIFHQKLSVFLLAQFLLFCGSAIAANLTENVPDIAMNCFETFRGETKPAAVCDFFCTIKSTTVTGKKVTRVEIFNSKPNANGSHKQWLFYRYFGGANQEPLVDYGLNYLLLGEDASCYFEGLGETGSSTHGFKFEKFSQ
jgi:hypothetical protein